MNEGETLEAINSVARQVFRLLNVPQALRADIKSICSLSVIENAHSCEAKGQAVNRRNLYLAAYKASLRWLEKEQRQRRNVSLTCDPPAPAEDLQAGDLDEHLAKLSPRYQRLLRLRYWEGLTLAEVAAEVGEPLPSVAKAIKRAEGELRQALAL